MKQVQETPNVIGTYYVTAHEGDPTVNGTYTCPPNLPGSPTRDIPFSHTISNTASAGKNSHTTDTSFSTTTEETSKGAIGTGKIIFKPIEAKFIQEQKPIGDIQPYCKISLGRHSGRSLPTKNEGFYCKWSDAIVLQRKHDEKYAKLKIKDKDRSVLRDQIGHVKINLEEVLAKGQTSQWYAFSRGTKVHGEIYIDIKYLCE